MQKVKNIVAILALFLSYHVAALKVGIVDLQVVSSESEMIKKMYAGMENKYKNRIEDLQLKQSSLQNKAEQFKKNRLTLTEQEISSTNNDIANLKKSIDRETEDLQMDLQKAQIEISKKIENILNSKTKLIAKEKALDLVFLKQATFFYNESSAYIIDITDDIIQLMQ